MMQPKRIVCPTATSAEIDVLRRIIGLLDSYLSGPWTIERQGKADIWLVDLDHKNAANLFDDAPAAPVVAYSNQVRDRGKQIGPATLSRVIHKSFRASEILAVVQDFEKRTASSREQRAEPAKGRSQTQSANAFRLTRWPPNPGRLPHDSRKIIALISLKPSTVGQIVARLDVSERAVKECLKRLNESGCLERSSARRDAPPVKPRATHSGVLGFLGAIRRRMGISH